MVVNGVKVLSPEHLEELISNMDESSKEGLRILYEEEQKAS
jgi:hypothetical protein